jgi:hypothetical protein
MKYMNEVILIIAIPKTPDQVLLFCPMRKVDWRVVRVLR